MRLSLLCRVALAAAALAVGSGAQAVKNPSSIALKPASKNGVLLLGLPPAAAEYKLWFIKEGGGGFGSRVYLLGPDRSGSAPRTFAARTLGAGRYVLKFVVQQNAWMACLAERTIIFDIKPGTINYLGHIDARPTLDYIQRAAVSRGDLTGGGGQGGGIYKDAVVTPVLSGRETADLDEARSFAASQMPKSEVPIILAAAETYVFAGIDDAKAKKRICG